MATTRRFDVKDIALAPEGLSRIEWADRQMPVLAAIRDRFAREQPLSGYGISAFAIKGEDNDTYYQHIEAAVDQKPQLTMDDGADVIGVLHSHRREQLGDILGGTEETTTGVIRLRALERDGALGFPVIAVNDANTKHLFD